MKDYDYSSIIINFDKSNQEVFLVEVFDILADHDKVVAKSEFCVQAERVPLHLNIVGLLQVVKALTRKIKEESGITRWR